MKRLISIFLFLVFSISLSKASELIVRVNDASTFYVKINDKYYHSHLGTAVISNLNYGKHYLEIHVKTPYVIDKYEVIFAGIIQIPYQKRVITELDHSNVLRVLREENISVYGQSYSGGAYVEPYGYNSYGNYGNSCNNYGYNNGYNHQGNYYYQEGAYNRYSYGMHPNSFNALIDILSDESFDSERLKIASIAIVDGITCRQLLSILDMFTFDSNRLQLAKRAYPHIVDRSNIFILEEAFTFSSNAHDFFTFAGCRY